MTAPRSLTMALLAVLTTSASAQMNSDHSDAHKPAPAASTELLVSGLQGKSRTLKPADLKAMPHLAVTVHNAHTNKDESYSGVAVRDLLALVEPANGQGLKVSANMQVVVASATDGFHVALTLCDTNPECRSGQVIVADMQDGAAIGTDGAFKLILTEDKKPARWARNLQSLTVRAVPSN